MLPGSASARPHSDRRPGIPLPRSYRPSDDRGRRDSQLLSEAQTDNMRGENMAVKHEEIAYADKHIKKHL